MSTRQYIGARYVPIFDGPWSNEKEYEPLTIVTYMGNSYTSRKTVPVGTPTTNTEYWALTGNYNAQVEQYRQETAQLQTTVNSNSNLIAGLRSDLTDATTELGGDIDALESGLSSAQSDIATAQSNINTLTASKGIRKRIICIGDSIAQGWYPGGTQLLGWPERLRNRLGLAANVDFFTGAAGGIGFVANNDGSGSTFDVTLQNLSVTNPETITDIYVVGGVNDATIHANKSSMINAVAALCAHARSRFPNAHVHLGCIAYYANAYNEPQYIRPIHEGVREGCSGNATVIPGIAGAMVGTANYNADGIHVNDTIENRIARCILSNCGCAFSIDMAATAVTSMTNNYPLINAYIEDDNLHYHKSGTTFMTIAGTFKCDGTYYHIANVSNSGIHGLVYGGSSALAANHQGIPWHGMVQKTDNTYVEAYGVISIWDKKF